MKNANWYFDFLSPFTYLQNCRIDEFSPDLNIQRKPVLFAGLLKHWGTKGPAELPAKRLFTYQHVHWLADQLEAPLRFPEKHPFNPIALLRLCIAGGCTKNAVDAIFKCVWVKVCPVTILITGQGSVMQSTSRNLKPQKKFPTLRSSRN